MLSLAHTIVSLPIGIYFQNPFLIFILAFALHFGTDSLLHWNFDPKDKRWRTYILIIIEVFSGVMAARLLTGQAFWTIQIWAAIAGGNAPDVLHMIWYWFTPEQRNKWPRWAKIYFSLHEAIQLETTNILLGIIPQAVLVGVAVLLILY